MEEVNAYGLGLPLQMPQKGSQNTLLKAGRWFDTIAAKIATRRALQTFVMVGFFLSGLCAWREKFVGNFVLKIQTPSILPPWIVFLEVISRELVLEASFSQARSFLSHWMLCCSFVALLALILCEALLLPMKSGRVRGKTNQGEQEVKTTKKVRKRAWNFQG